MGVTTSSLQIEGTREKRGESVWDAFANEGKGPRFGIVHLDYGTLRRIPKDSYFFYSGVIKNNGIIKNHNFPSLSLKPREAPVALDIKKTPIADKGYNKKNPTSAKDG